MYGINVIICKTCENNFISNLIGKNMNFKRYQMNRGIALVAVLAILVVLAILASTMSVLVNIEQKSAKSQFASQSVSLIIDSGIEHAKAIIEVSHGMETKFGEPNKDYLFSEFGQPVVRLNTPNGQNEKSDSSKKNKHNWQYIYDETGALQGRYEIIVEDEAAKVNINTAALLGKSKGSGWSTSEISLPHALGMPPKYTKKILEYRYGPNKLPGMRGDDDKNNVFLMSDGIDNNANGIIDEHDEGIDDPQEYDSKFPVGDDRVFTTIVDAATPLFNANAKIMTKEQRRLCKVFPRRTTLYSVDYPGSPTLPNDQPADVNAVTARQCRRRLIKANKLVPFQNNAKALDQLAVNIVDYRDQNHVLSTIGGSYGVEAVCFNELLANDGTQGRTVKNSTDSNYDDDEFVFAESSIVGGNNAAWGKKPYNIDKSDVYYKENRTFAWDVKINSIKSGKATAQLLGPDKDKNGKDLWAANAINKYKKFGKARTDIGNYRSKSRSNNGITYDSVSWPKNFFKNGYIVIANTREDLIAALNNDKDVSNVNVNNKTGKITEAQGKVK